MKIKKFKNIVVFLIGVVAVLLIILFSRYAKNYFVNTNKILYNLNDLKKLDNNLNYNILSSSMFLYYDNDKIVKNIDKINQILQKTENLAFFKNHYKTAYAKYLKYENKYKNKEKLVYEYLRFNFPLKNSLIYLSNSLKHMDFQKKDMQKILDVVSNVFLAKNAIDMDFLKQIDLKQFDFLKKSKNRFQYAFYLNLKVFLKYFPMYQKYLKQILDYPTKQYLNRVFSSFMTRVQKDLKIFDVLSYVLTAFIGILMISISFTIKQLEEKVRTITHLISHDSLTSLYNRFQFNNDIKKYKKPAVVVFNIDKFKNINDAFGNDIGDLVLKKTATILEIIFSNKNMYVYRIGADDFAVIFDSLKYSNEKVLEFTKKAMTKIEKEKIIIHDTPFNISISAGISFEKPYLENADMALKFIKKDVNIKVGVFDKKMNEEIWQNLSKTKEIKEAIESDNIFPYFQPIFDSSQNIIKYEVLCRVKIDKEIKSIYPYLSLLKEIKLYYKITEKILKDSIMILRKYPQIHLSINLSVEDLNNFHVYSMLKKYFKDENIAKRITFEILESEIENYDVFIKFIEEFKKYGITFSIDDFGSGYSNFSRVLSLNVDYLKIDGSLIKNIDNDNQSRLIVETIIGFAKKTNIKTVAEFIHSKDVFEISKSLGIDYFQGFYLGEPSEKLINVKKM